MMHFSLTPSVYPTLKQICSTCGADYGDANRLARATTAALVGVVGRLCRCGQSVHTRIQVDEKTTCMYCKNPDHWKLIDVEC